MPYSLDALNARLREGIKEENRMAHRLRMRGYGCDLPPWRLRTEDEPTDVFQDTRDLRVYGESGAQLTVEVKGRNQAFAGPASWPFPDAICYATTKPDPDLLLIPSKLTRPGIVAVFPKLQCFNFFRRMQHDNERDIDYEVFCIAKEFLRSWDDVLAFLRTRIGT